MAHLRLHRKVFIWYGRWWAIQFVRMWDEFGFGIRPIFRRKLLDIYLGPITIAFGKHPVLTDPRTRQRDCCRGFVFEDDEVAKIL